MIKRVSKILIIVVLLFFTTVYVFADGKQPPPPSKKKGNFSKGNFSKNNAYSRNGKSLTPPNPSDGTGGNTVPISNGLVFLLIGSAIYIVGRIRKEDE